VQITISTADFPHVAADIPHIHSLVARVISGIGQPEFMLRPRREITILAQDTTSVELLTIEAKAHLPYREQTIFADISDAETHDHELDETDPHAWLDPENGKSWFQIIADQLAGVDPQNTPAYFTNAVEGIAEINAAMVQIDAEIASLYDANYLVFHDTYQYFEAHFGLSPLGAISPSDATDPSPARIRQLQQAIADQRVDCVFSEPQFNTGTVDVVIGRSLADLIVIDPLGTTTEISGNLYVELLRTL
jgi:zinc transport system substrate-binding protein